MTITACTTLSFIQLLHLDEVALFVLGKHHLCYALTIIDDEVLLREVDEQHHDFATVIGIDGTRSIEHGDAMLQSETATRSYLRFITSRQCHEKPRRNCLLYTSDAADEL